MICWCYLEVLILSPNCRSPKTLNSWFKKKIKIFLALDHKEAEKSPIHRYSQWNWAICVQVRWMSIAQTKYFLSINCATLVRLNIHRYENSFFWDLSVVYTMLQRPKNPPPPKKKTLCEWAHALSNYFFI